MQLNLVALFDGPKLTMNRNPRKRKKNKKSMYRQKGFFLLKMRLRLLHIQTKTGLLFLHPTDSYVTLKLETATLMSLMVFYDFYPMSPPLHPKNEINITNQ